MPSTAGFDNLVAWELSDDSEGVQPLFGERYPGVEPAGEGTISRRYCIVHQAGDVRSKEDVPIY